MLVPLSSLLRPELFGSPPVRNQLSKKKKRLKKCYSPYLCSTAAPCVLLHPWSSSGLNAPHSTTSSEPRLSKTYSLRIHDLIIGDHSGMQHRMVLIPHNEITFYLPVRFCQMAGEVEPCSSPWQAGTQLHLGFLSCTFLQSTVRRCSREGRGY